MLVGFRRALMGPTPKRLLPLRPTTQPACISRLLSSRVATEPITEPPQNQLGFLRSVGILERLAPWFGWFLVVWTVWVTYRGEHNR